MFEFKIFFNLRLQFNISREVIKIKEIWDAHKEILQDQMMMELKDKAN